ncbi:ATP-dependent helicase NAM7 [Arthrobotrys musiformis]|uniref:ATP-dependent helicase NAM7 n=1 Tax=Arthrobotrys musiformis TaxID=47236 RepID=A0AAV9VX37_9PEZI
MDKLIPLKIHQGQKYYLRWQARNSNRYHDGVCSVSAEDVQIVETSTNILYSLVVAFPENEVPVAKTFIVAGRPDKTTYQRIKAALKAIDTAPESSPAARVYRSVLLGEPSKLVCQSDRIHAIHNKVLREELDSSQINAAKTALRYDFTTIQGPPGTGKTTTITNIIEAYIRGEMDYQQQLGFPKPQAQILVTAPTNSAVNHLARQWKARVLNDKTGFLQSLRVIRWIPDGFYRPVGISGQAMKERRRADAEYSDGSDDDEDGDGDDAPASLALEIADNLKTNFPQEYSVMEHRKEHPRWEEYERLFLEILRGGVAAKATMGQFSDVRSDIDFDILKETTIVLSTQMGAGTYQVRRYFRAEMVIIDEAGQSPEPLAAIPMSLRTMKQFVLVGDHVQLPPLSTHNIPILGTSLLEKLASFRDAGLQKQLKECQSGFQTARQQGESVEERGAVRPSRGGGNETTVGPEHYPSQGSEVPDEFEEPAKIPPDALGIQWALLRRNYRSRPGIVGIVSKYFYDGKLESARQGNIDGDAFNLYFNRGETSVSANNIPEVLWQDIECDSDQIDATSHSKFNLSSTYHILDLLSYLETVGVDIDVNDLAIIPMYNSQVGLLRAAIQRFLRGKMKEVRVDTVDSFQGQEKKFIIVDLVRSNSEKAIGFLHDVRRFNVAISRGMEKTIIVGDKGLYTSPIFSYGRENRTITNLSNEIASAAGALAPAKSEREHRMLYPGLEDLVRG